MATQDQPTSFLLNWMPFKSISYNFQWQMLTKNGGTYRFLNQSHPWKRSKRHVRQFFASLTEVHPLHGPEERQGGTGADL